MLETNRFNNLIEVLLNLAQLVFIYLLWGGKNNNFIFTNLKLKFIMLLKFECRQQATVTLEVPVMLTK